MLQGFFPCVCLTVFDDEIHLRGRVSVKGQKLNLGLNFVINEEQFWWCGEAIGFPGDCVCV